jgi:serine/threonine protein kinase
MLRSRKGEWIFRPIFVSGCLLAFGLVGDVLEENQGWGDKTDVTHPLLSSWFSFSSGCSRHKVVILSPSGAGLTWPRKKHGNEALLMMMMMVLNLTFFYSRGMSPSEVECCFKQILRGVEYLHNQGVAHRDIKPENLFFDTRGNLKVRISVI